MCCKNKFAIKFAAILLAAVGVSSMLSGADNAGTSNDLVINPFRHAPDYTPVFHPNASEPLAQLFQILFILFIISPPIIVVILFLIYKELKSRNKLK